MPEEKSQPPPSPPSPPFNSKVIGFILTLLGGIIMTVNESNLIPVSSRWHGLITAAAGGMTAIGYGGVTWGRK